MPRQRIGVVGSGFIAREHVRAWSRLDVEIGICSLETGTRDELCQRFGAVAYDTLDDLLAAATIVDVCTPTDTHHGIVLRAAQAGRQVICEKPLARHVDQARQMIGGCAGAGVALLPAHVVRYFPEYAAAQAAVAGGRIGTPAILRFTRRGSVPTWSAWYRDERRSGGLLMDFMIHDYDIARWLAGQVRRVYARLAGAGDAGGVTGLVVLTHDGGAVSHVHGAWVPDMGGLTTDFELSGDRGVLSSPAGSALSAGPGGPAGRGQFATGRASPFATELAEFLAAIDGGREPRVSAADGLAAVAIAEAAIESAHTGAAVSLDAAVSLNGGPR